MANRLFRVEIEAAERSARVGLFLFPRDLRRLEARNLLLKRGNLLNANIFLDLMRLV